MKDNYKTIEAKLATLTPFNGYSMRGYWDDSRHRFLVFSYNTVIGYSTLSGFGISDEKYSNTTSRHQNLLRKVWESKAKN